jgi:hypothetical protein
MALTPLSPAVLNTKISPSTSILEIDTPSKTMAPSRMDVTPSKPVQVTNEEDEMCWDDGPSSPFVTTFEGAESRKASAQLPAQDLDLDLDMTPSEQLQMESAPFSICEDETNTPMECEVEPPTPATVRGTPATTTFHSVQNTPVAFPSIVQQAPSFPAKTEDMEVFDDTMLGGDDTIDDTCFSAFSEIPGMDMTRFARMGESPSKGGVDMVCLTTLF